MFDFYAEQAGCGAATEAVAARMACLRNASVGALARAQDAAKYVILLGLNSFFDVKSQDLEYRLQVVYPIPGRNNIYRNTVNCHTKRPLPKHTTHSWVC